MVALGQYRNISELVLKKKQGDYIFKEIGKLKMILDESIQ
jgi:hypothetical protein